MKAEFLPYLLPPVLPHAAGKNVSLSSSLFSWISICSSCRPKRFSREADQGWLGLVLATVGFGFLGFGIGFSFNRFSNQSYRLIGGRLTQRILNLNTRLWTRFLGLRIGFSFNQFFDWSQRLIGGRLVQRSLNLNTRLWAEVSREQDVAAISLAMFHNQRVPMDANEIRESVKEFFLDKGRVLNYARSLAIYKASEIGNDGGRNHRAKEAFSVEVVRITVSSVLKGECLQWLGLSFSGLWRSCLAENQFGIADFLTEFQYEKSFNLPFQKSSLKWKVMNEIRRVNGDWRRLWEVKTTLMMVINLGNFKVKGNYSFHGRCNQCANMLILVWI